MIYYIHFSAKKNYIKVNVQSPKTWKGMDQFPVQFFRYKPPLTFLLPFLIFYLSLTASINPRG